MYIITLLFTENYSCDASDTTFTSSEGNLSSPGWPAGYTNFLHCVYEISLGSESEQIVVNFTHFDVEFADSCQYDYVQVSKANFS